MLRVELTESLGELVAAVIEQRKAGSLVLTVKVTPNKDGVTVLVTDKVKLTKPEAERGGAIFFVDAFGSLSRSNPLQPELPLREAPKRQEVAS